MYFKEFSCNKTENMQVRCVPRFIQRFLRILYFSISFFAWKINTFRRLRTIFPKKYRQFSSAVQQILVHYDEKSARLDANARIYIDFPAYL